MHSYSVDGGSRCAYGRAGTADVVLARTAALEGTRLKLMKSPDIRGWFLKGALALLTVTAATVTIFDFQAQAGSSLEERKMPMKFNWVACQPNCRGWVTAVGIVTADSPGEFEAFARGRDLEGVTVVLDSSGGSVNDSITLGRRFRQLSMRTTVGLSIQAHTALGDRPVVLPEAYCESMCAYLLLAGKTRYVPQSAHVRVHQIWMGDRADDAQAASYTAQDLMIVERDIGRLAKYTFEMGGAGDLLSLSLNVPPWEDLHELSQTELRLTNLVTTDVIAEVLPQTDAPPTGALAAKSVHDRFAGGADPDPQPRKSTRTAEATAATAAPAQ
jgi:hypothetical protein